MQSKNNVQSIQCVKAALEILSRELTHPICYSEAAFRIGLPVSEANRYCSSIITRALNLMCKEDRLKNCAFRATLFVSKKHGIPGKGFWASEDIGLGWVADRDKFAVHEALLAELLVRKKSQPQARLSRNAQNKMNEREILNLE